jgi:phosphoribosylformimino-5-aminoimidazole carboxamide ribotide isomerase
VIAYAAIDLRGGRVVQLVGGRVEDERVSLPDPVAIAAQWQAAGFAALHVVDLDAALGRGNNRDVIADIMRAVDIPVQVGGGIRDEAAVEQMIDLGAERVIVGTRAVEDALWMRSVAQKFPGRIVVAADVRDRVVVTRGWQSTTPYHIESFLEVANDEPLAALLVTDVSREGRMTGIDVDMFANVVRSSKHPLIAAGGIRDNSDLKRLTEIGAAGAVLGMALYQGAIDMTGIVGEYVA